MTCPQPHGRVLTVAGSDSGAGAGIQADLKTIAALGGWGSCAVTAVTAQNTQGIRASVALPADIVAAQIDAVVEDIGIDALKTGMLGSVAVVGIVRALLARHPVPLVVDPVLRSTSGTALADAALIDALRADLLPAAALVTPNLDETEHLLGWPAGSARDRAAMERAAAALLARGCRAVLIKGGHLDSETLADYYADASGDSAWFAHPRIASRNLHGTGCTLASAIALGLARGRGMKEAIGVGVAYTQDAIAGARAWRIGKGQGPLAHVQAVAWSR